MIGWRRKKENRRFERRHVLDVKLRAEQLRAVRLRRAGLVLSLVFVLGVLGFFGTRGGRWVLDRLVFANPAFAVRTVQVQSSGRIPGEWIRRWSGVQTGQNLFALDLGRVQENLEMVPLLSSVMVERVLPGTIRIRVAEREAVAQVRVSRLGGEAGGVRQDVFLVDGEGWVMQPLPTGRAGVTIPPVDETMPVLSGLAAAEVRTGSRIDSTKVQSALRLVSTFRDSPMFGRATLVEIDLGGPEVLEARTASGARVVFGLKALDRQMLRWRAVYDESMRLGRGIRLLDLSITNNLPVHWVQETGGSPGGMGGGPPASPSTERRNDHV